MNPRREALRPAMSDLLDLPVSTLQGEPTTVGALTGNGVALVVNVASRCGLTPQYAGLQALADPSIGAALGLMHGRLSEPWTVERLAAAVGLSRSGFAARFHALVGEPPLHYLARWRMMKAAQWLLETGDSIPHIAERVGYDSAVAFTKAFKRWHGIGPGGYRRAQAERDATAAG